jgi:hypothetical protein
VALDINLHGPRFIIVEFGVGTPAIITVGLLLMLGSSAFLLGLYILLTGIDYLPLLAYAIVLIRNHTAEKEFSYGLSQDKHYNRKYSIQQLMIFLPAVILLIAVIQELKKHN